MYNTFMRHAKKVTRAKHIESREILRGVHHYEGGAVAVTDSHRLYYMNSLHDKKPGTYLPDGPEVKGNYPEVKRLIPDEADHPLLLQVPGMIKAVDFMHAVSKFSKHGPVVDWKGKELKVMTFDSYATYALDEKLPIDGGVSFNAKYWLEALQLFKAMGYSDFKFTIVSSVLPMMLRSTDNRLTVIILPVRRH